MIFEKQPGRTRKPIIELKIKFSGSGFVTILLKRFYQSY